MPPRNARKLQPGDTELSAGNWSDLSDNANRVNQFSVGNDMTLWNTNKAGIHFKNTRETPYQSHLLVKRGSKRLVLTAGSFTQDGVTLDLSGLSTSLPAGFAVSSSYLVSYRAILSASGELTDVLTSLNQLPYIETSPDNPLFRLGRFNTGTGATPKIIKLFQDWQGGFINRGTGAGPITPDANSGVPNKPQFINTINFRPVKDAHEGELQLYNVQKISTSNYGIPFLRIDSSSALLRWLTPDSDRRIAAAGEVGSSAGRIKSISKVADVSSSIVGLQIWGFKQNVDPGDMNTSDDFRPLMRHPTGLNAESTSGEVIYPTRNKFANWLESAITINSSQIQGGFISTSLIPHAQTDFVIGAGRANLLMGANKNHDLRLRYALAMGSSTRTGFGRDDKSYETSGKDGARKFYITDSSGGNHWTAGTLQVDTSQGINIKSGTDKTIDIFQGALGTGLHIGSFSELAHPLEVRLTTSLLTETILGDLTIDGFLTVDIATIHHGHITEQFDFVPPAAGGLNGLQVAWDAFHSNMRALGFEAPS